MEVLRDGSEMEVLRGGSEMEVLRGGSEMAVFRDEDERQHSAPNAKGCRKGKERKKERKYWQTNGQPLPSVTRFF